MDNYTAVPLKSDLWAILLLWLYSIMHTKILFYIYAEDPHFSLLNSLAKLRRRLRELENSEMEKEGLVN